MGYFNSQIITKAGAELLAKASAGKKIVFDKMYTGSGQYTVKEIAELLNATDLKEPQQSFAISSCDQEHEQIRLRATISNNGLQKGYDITEIGLYAKEDGKESVLVAISIYTDNKPTHLPQFEDTPVEIYVSNVLAFSGDGNFSIEYRSDVYVTTKEFREEIDRYALQDNLDTHVNDQESHVTPEERKGWNKAKKHAESTHARADATKVEKSTTNGNVLINETETQVYRHPSSHSIEEIAGLQKSLDNKVNNDANGADSLLSQIGATWTATPNDDTYFIRQDTGGKKEFGRVKFSTLWAFIKGKADSVYAKLSHTHTKDQIIDFPTSIAANGGNSATVNGHTVNSDVPTNAKFTDTTYPISYKTIDGSFLNNFRTETKGDTAVGDFISIIRSEADIVGAGAYGSGLAFGRGDTHGYLYVDYGTANAYLGGGNANLLKWHKKISFSDHEHTTVNGHTVNADVPSDAKFTDTNTWRPQPDWNAASGDAAIKNKPTIPSATAVKGDAETTYRTGNVNLTPSNIGAVSQTEFDDLSIGGRNLARDTNQGTVNWFWLMQTGTHTKEEVLEDGIRTCKMTRCDDAQSGWSVIYFEDISRDRWLPNTDYIITVEVKSNVTTTFNLYGISANDGSGKLNSKIDVVNNNIKSGEWVTLQWLCKTSNPLPTQTNQVLYMDNMNSAPGVYYQFRNLKIEKGNKATDWTPAPEDLVKESKDYTDTKVAAYLPEYEEGIWTPTFSVGAAGLSGSTGNCIYKKIGNVVHVQAYAKISGGGSMVSVGGFPYRIETSGDSSYGSLQSTPIQCYIGNATTPNQLVSFNGSSSVVIPSVNVSNNTPIIINGYYFTDE